MCIDLCSTSKWFSLQRFSCAKLVKKVYNELGLVNLYKREHSSCRKKGFPNIKFNEHLRLKFEHVPHLAEQPNPLYVG